VTKRDGEEEWDADHAILYNNLCNKKDYGLIVANQSILDDLNCDASRSVIKLKKVIKDSFKLSEEQYTKSATEFKANLSHLKIVLGCDMRTVLKLSEAVHFQKLGYGVRTLTARWMKELGVHEVPGCSKQELTGCAATYGYEAEDEDCST
jgi:hypothetical protein